MGWTVLIYRLPSDDSRARVAVWRELRRSGALHVQQSVVAVPDADGFADDVERLREAWNAAREAEYRELAGECGKFLREIDHEFEIEKFSHAELDEEEAELEKLQRWHERIRGRDVHDAPGADAAARAVQDAEGALTRYADAVFERTEP